MSSHGMSNDEFRNNVILKIYHDSETNKLVLLKARNNHSLYIAIINLNDNSLVTADIRDVFFSYTRSLYESAPIEIRNTVSRNYDNLISGYKRNFILVHTIYAFDVELTGSKLLFDAECAEYTIAETGLRTHAKPEKCRFIITLDGEIHTLKKGLDWEHWGHDDETNFLRFLDPGTIITGGGSEGVGEKKLILWDFANDESIETDLGRWNDFYYEYIGSFALLKHDRLLALVYENPTYGQDCIKILKIGLDYSLNLVFNYAFHDCRLVFMTFGPNQGEFTILEYTDYLDRSSPSVNIRIYGINETHIPQKIIATTLNHGANFIMEIRYYSEEVLAIITTDKIFLYNVVNGGEIDILIKDPRRPYYVSADKIYYIWGDELTIYTLEQGSLQYAKGRIPPQSLYTKTITPPPQLPPLPPPEEIPWSRRVKGILRLLLIIIIVTLLFRSCWNVMHPSSQEFSL